VATHTSIEIRHLKTFLAVVETENFTRAAERLRLSQPSVSQQIKELETGLGTTLFDRLGTRVRLTQAGQAFHERAAVVMSRFAEACESVVHLEGSLVGHINVGCIPPLNMAWMPPVLERFAVEYPGVTVAVHEAPSYAVETEVEAGRFDLGVGLLSRAAPGVRYERLAQDEFVLLVPKKDKLAKQDEVSLKDLRGVGLALLPQSFTVRPMVDEAFRRAQVRPKVCYQLSTIESLLITCARCQKPTLLPSVVMTGREDLGLKIVRISSWMPSIELGFMWPGSSQPGPIAQSFAQALRAFVKLHPPAASRARAPRSAPRSAKRAQTNHSPRPKRA
jgi:LysR family transcriptional regulator, cyn operon transcriptional activator